MRSASALPSNFCRQSQQNDRPSGAFHESHPIAVRRPRRHPHRAAVEQVDTIEKIRFMPDAVRAAMRQAQLGVQACDGVSNRDGEGRLVPAEELRRAASVHDGCFLLARHRVRCRVRRGRGLDDRHPGRPAGRGAGRPRRMGPAPADRRRLGAAARRARKRAGPRHPPFRLPQRARQQRPAAGGGFRARRRDAGRLRGGAGQVGGDAFRRNFRELLDPAGADRAVGHRAAQAGRQEIPLPGRHPAGLQPRDDPGAAARLRRNRPPGEAAQSPGGRRRPGGDRISGRWRDSAAGARPARPDRLRVERLPGRAGSRRQPAFRRGLHRSPRGEERSAEPSRGILPVELDGDLVSTKSKPTRRWPPPATARRR